MSQKYSTIKILTTVKTRLEDYARPRGLTLSAAVNELLDKADLLEVLLSIKELLEEQNKLLREQNALLRSLPLRPLPKAGAEASTPEPEPLGLPSFVEGNPWVKIIASRGGE